MDNHKERQLFMEDQLDSLGLDYTRVVGVNGNSLTQEELEMYTSREKFFLANKHYFLPGEIGCALSHRNAYDQVLEGNIPYAVILEDDVTLPQNFKEILQKEVAENEKRNSWEYLAFDYTTPGFPYLRFWFRSIKLRLRAASFLGRISLLLQSLVKGGYILPLSLFEGLRNFFCRYRPGPVTFFRPLYLAGCYMITTSAAQKMRDLNTPIVYPADRVQNQARVRKQMKLKAYAPCIVRQEKMRFGSIITGKFGKDL